MKYRNKKRKAATWILSTIIKPRTARITGLKNFEGRLPYVEINEKYYDSYNFLDLLEASKIDRKILLDAAELLFINEEIQKSENSDNVYNITIKANKSGEIAYYEDKYQDDIDEYASNRIYRNTRWWLPSLAMLVSLVVFAYTIYKDKTKKDETQKMQSDISELKSQINLLQQEVNATKIIANPPRIVDTTHANNGQ